MTDLGKCETKIELRYLTFGCPPNDSLREAGRETLELLFAVIP